MAYAQQTRQTANDMASDARNMAEDTYRQYKPELERYANDFAGIVKDKPIQSLAIAGAVAFVIGALWRR